MSVAFNGFNENVATFEAATGVTPGKPVTMSANNKVQAVTSGTFCGICTNVRQGYAGVQLKGFVTVAYTGSVSVGYQKLVATSGGKVTVDTNNGREYLVVEVNSTAGTIGFML